MRKLSYIVLREIAVYWLFRETMYSCSKCITLTHNYDATGSSWISEGQGRVLLCGGEARHSIREAMRIYVDCHIEHLADMRYGYSFGLCETLHNQ